MIKRILVVMLLAACGVAQARVTPQDDATYERRMAKGGLLPKMRKYFARRYAPEEMTAAGWDVGAVLGKEAITERGPGVAVGDRIGSALSAILARTTKETDSAKEGAKPGYLSRFGSHVLRNKYRYMLATLLAGILARAGQGAYHAKQDSATETKDKNPYAGGWLGVMDSANYGYRAYGAAQRYFTND